VVSDRTPTIRASLREVERALAIAVGLVILVVFPVPAQRAFATAHPSVAVPGVAGRHLWRDVPGGYTLDNLSLMALTVATGFVVDDAIVVLENITRHMERGKSALQAALDGAREIGFTVVSISLSLIAVFIPILFMGGIVGRLFREFAVVLSSAILVSMVVSLTTTPMMCARLAAPAAAHRRSGAAGWPGARSDPGGAAAGLPPQPGLDACATSRWCCWPWPAWWGSTSTCTGIEKGFLSPAGHGRIVGFIRADQSTSFQAMQQRLDRFLAIVSSRPGGGERHRLHRRLSAQRGADVHGTQAAGRARASADQVMDRLRQQALQRAGARLFMVPQQDIRIGGRQSNAATSTPCRPMTWKTCAPGSRASARP
jgi:multidrug efflux pump